MVELIGIFIISFVIFGSTIYRLFLFTKQGHTHHDIYEQRKYGIEPDRSDDHEETVTFDESSSLEREGEGH
ncbi:hypothetical protein IRB23SM22_07070 [Alkalibacterium sp. s-m-22]